MSATSMQIYSSSVIFLLLLPILVVGYPAEFPEDDAKLSRDLITNPMPNINLTTGIGGGFYRMKDQQVIQITSSNYGVDNYFHGDANTWRFFGTDCGVSAKCPCFDVPSSIKCIGDYLKISDIPFYDQRFCGTVMPTGIYRSVTGHLKLRFRADFADAGQGFLCYVSCTAPGKADPPLPTTPCFPSTARTTTAPTSTTPCPVTQPPTGDEPPPDSEVPIDPVCNPGTKIRQKPSTSGEYQQNKPTDFVNWVPVGSS